MSAPHADQIVDGYLARLEVALGGLPLARRSELIDDLRAHITEARAQLADGETDTSLLDLVERLGDPRVIAADALERADTGTPSEAADRTRWGWLELAGIVLTVVVWPVGAILVLLSPAWSRREKLVGMGLGVVPFLVNSFFAPLMPLVIGPLVANPGGVPPVVPMLFALVGALPLIAAGYLALRLYRRTPHLPGVTA